MYISSTNIKDRDLAKSEDMFHLAFSTILVDCIYVYHLRRPENVRQIRQEINHDFTANFIIKFDPTIKERVSDYDCVPFEQSIDKACLVMIVESRPN